MDKGRKLIIAGNWKMNKTVAEALDLVNGLKRELGNIKEIDIVVCPPFTALSDVSKAILNTNIRLGAQDYRTFNAKGKLLTAVTAPGGVRKTTSISPTNGTLVAGGEHHWHTGREPWRCPSLPSSARSVWPASPSHPLRLTTTGRKRLRSTIRAETDSGSCPAPLGRIGIEPYDETLLQPSSVDVRVDRYFRVFRNSRYPFINVKEAQEELTELVEVGDEPFILHPGEFVLGSTLERVRLPDDLVARLEGKSSLGRLGLLIHSTAGFIDPGWDGHVTLELSNVANLPITIYYGMKIGQLSFVQLSEPAEKPYGAHGLGSKYQGQKGPTPSRYWQNFTT